MTILATCRTPACGNADHALDVTDLMPDRDTPVVCGACGVQITDVAEA